MYLVNSPPIKYWIFCENVSHKTIEYIFFLGVMYKKDEINKQGGKFVKKIINKQVLIRESRVEKFEKIIK